ncbi:MAG: fumarylacetoacetate hydrolase family protein [Acidimicrobiia bacterium]|nr:fumarylacetoacetate hydrolase family protein [Acidimicrobiia bacterium]MDH3397652.1 fumarylacetoacetate hydrolase family protein [Acidimicrobiia bacterium]
MKIVRIRTDEGISYGGAEPDGIRVYQGSPLVAWEPTEVVVPFDRAHLLAPVFPTKVVAVGRNYAEHAEEMGADVLESPIIFLKPATAVIGPGVPVVYPPDSEDVHHEAELAVVIGAVARNVKAEDVQNVILGYTAANDVTARDLQRKDGQWTRGKGFDTFCPLGPAIETELDPLVGLSVECRVNGEVRQSGSTADMVFGVAELVEFITRIMTLLPGDVVLTGTPSGVGPVMPGDRMEVEIEGIGVLFNPVGRR